MIEVTTKAAAKQMLGRDRICRGGSRWVKEREARLREEWDGAVL